MFNQGPIHLFPSKIITSVQVISFQFILHHLHMIPEQNVQILYQIDLLLLNWKLAKRNSHIYMVRYFSMDYITKIYYSGNDDNERYTVTIFAMCNSVNTQYFFINRCKIYMNMKKKKMLAILFAASADAMILTIVYIILINRNNRNKHFVKCLLLNMRCIKMFSSFHFLTVIIINNNLLFIYLLRN